MTADWNFYVQAIVGVVVITDPITRGIFFKVMTENEPQRRAAFVRTITITVAITLFGAALVGRELLDVMGINLGAFGFAGGMVVALMGAEMLFGGEPSRAQGGKQAREVQQPESFEKSAVVPYAIPFVAGPGAITIVISIASATSNGSGTIAALVAVAVAVILLPIGHLVVAKHLKLSEAAMGIATRIGGLLVLTIGVQLMMNGISTFYELN